MISAIKFILKDGSVHEFTEVSHDAEFEVLASQFSDGNKDIAERIETRDSEPDAPEAPVTPTEEVPEAPVEPEAPTEPVA